MRPKPTVVASLPPTTVPATTVPPILDGEPWIAFAMNNPLFGINFVRPDGTGLHVAMSGAPTSRQVNPDWSADGTQLAFAADDADGTVDVWTARADGSDARKVIECSAPCTGADEPAWSPDDRQLVFQRNVVNNGVLSSTLELIDIGTGTTSVVRTAPTNTVYLQPRWSPDGKLLVLEVLQLTSPVADAEQTGDGIGIVDLAHPEADVRMLTDFAHFSQSPDWSSAGDLIVYASRSVDGNSAADLFTVHPDGTNLRQITQLVSNNGAAFEPTFTPDGLRIIFVRSTDVNTSKRRIASVAIDGSDIRAEAEASSVQAYHPRLRPTP